MPDNSELMYAAEGGDNDSLPTSLPPFEVDGPSQTSNAQRLTEWLACERVARLNFQTRRLDVKKPVLRM